MNKKISPHATSRHRAHMPKVMTWRGVVIGAGIVTACLIMSACTNLDSETNTSSGTETTPTVATPSQKPAPSRTESLDEDTTYSGDMITLRSQEIVRLDTGTHTELHLSAPTDTRFMMGGDEDPASAYDCDAQSFSSVNGLMADFVVSCPGEGTGKRLFSTISDNSGVEYQFSQPLNVE